MTDNQPSTNPADKIILIVDDDDSVRELLTFLAKKEGFLVDTAVNGEEGLAKIEKLKPHLVVLDLMLPRFGGFEVLRRMQLGETKDIPVVIVTGKFMDPGTVEMIKLESNVKDFLEKPLKPAVFSALLHRILNTVPPGYGGSLAG